MVVESRERVKILRDGLKSRYKSKEPCFICGSTTLIELHHLYSVAELWSNWCKEKGIINPTAQETLEVRKQFEADNIDKLNNDNLYSLCQPHHRKLHHLYGKSYSNYSAEKVKRWLFLQRDKNGEINGPMDKLD